jgi:putative flippase GtrA
MVTAAERSRHKRITRYSWVGGVAAVILAAVTVHLFIKPLDVVWVILMRRFGI